MTVRDQQNSFCFYRGRVALYALLRALNLKPGDEVLIQAFTCSAVPAPIMSLGLTPIYVDIEPSSYNMDMKKVEAQVTAKTKALILQHTFGIPADIDSALALARRHGLALIEDCCHVLGSTHRGNETGWAGDAAFYSYEWGKPIVIGLGGMAITHSPELTASVGELYQRFVFPSRKDTLLVQMQYVAHRLFRRPALFWWVRGMYRVLSRLGILIGGFPDSRAVGKADDEYSRRMPLALQRRLAKIGRNIDAQIAHNKELGTLYERGFHELGLPCPCSPAGSDAVYLRYPLQVSDKTRVLSEARKQRVELGDWFSTPVHPVPQQRWPSTGYTKGSCPIAEVTSSRIVTLPLHRSVAVPDVKRSLDFLARMQQLGLIGDRVAPSTPCKISLPSEKPVFWQT